jgi:hypothetical protein
MAQEVTYFPGMVKGPASTTKQRRYRPPDPTNETPFVDPAQQGWDELYSQAPDMIKPIVQGASTFDRTTHQLQDNIASGVMQIPTDVAGMIDLVRVGAPALVKAIPDNPQQHDYVKRLTQEFANGIFGEDGQANIETYIKDKLSKFQQAMPTATPEQASAFIDQVQNSPEFFDFMTMQMSPGFQLAQRGNNFANHVAGLGKRPDQQTIVDDLEQVFGQSIVGLPSSVLKSLGERARKLVGNAVFDSVAGKATLKGLELATPLTLPYTPGNVALNTGVGAAITEATRDMSGSPSMLRGGVADLQPQQIATQIDPPDGHGINVGAQTDQTVVGAGITLASIFGFPAFRRAATKDAADAAMRAIEKTGLDAGPSLASQADRLKPQLSPITGLADANAPVKKGAAKFGASDGVIDHLDAQMSSASTVNRIEAEVNAINYGILANHPSTIPITEIQRSARQLPPEDYDLLNKYMYAKQRDQDAKLYAKTLTDELASQNVSYRAARARGDVRAANAAYEKVTSLNDELVKLQNDDPMSRSSMVNWSKSDVAEIIRTAEANGAVKTVADAMAKVGNDVTTFLQKNGRISADEATRRLHDRPVYVPLRERAYPDTQNSVVRKGLLMRDRLFGKRSEEGFYVPGVTRDVRGQDLHATVNKPKDALVALQEGLMDAVRDVTANNARLKVIDALKSLPNADGTLIRQHKFKFGSRETGSVSEAQFEAQGRKQLGKDRSRYVRVVRNGLNEFYEFSDPSITQSLQFAPLASVPILNATRRLWQTFTTGLGAPWFAVKSAVWDVPMARVTSRQGRSLGLIDTYARMIFNESPIVNTVMDHVPDPTAWLSAGLAIPYQVSMRAVRSVGMKIASDLEHNAGFFDMLAKMPGGREYLSFVGESMAKTFDRSVFHVYSRNLSTTLSHLTDASKIADDYVVRGKGSALGNGFRSVINSYKAMVESVQNSTRMAFFVENYSRLQAKHAGKIPESELEKLVQETRNLTGDMSRVSNSKFIQGLNTVVPYGNPILQGTRHILSATITPSMAKGVNALTGGKANMLTARTNKFWSQFTGGMLLPTLGAMSLIDQWPGAQDWWYNKVPEWQQGTVIPFPTYEALEYYHEHGEWPPFDPKYVHMLPIAPEFGIIQAPITAALRAMGLFGPATNHIGSNFTSQLASAFDQITGFATPPALQALAAYNGGRFDLRSGLNGQGFFQDSNPTAFGGANADQMSPNSEISKKLYDIIGALTSSSGQMIAQTWNVGDLAMKEGDGFGKAFGKAFDTFKYEVSRRLPNVPGLGGLDRNYAFTPESEYVYNTEKVLEPILGPGRQHSVETDQKNRIPTLEKMGLTPPEKVKEPLLRKLSSIVYDSTSKKGPYQAAGDQYTEKRVQLGALENSRGRWPVEAYDAEYNKIVQDQQKLKAVQARLLNKMEGDLQNTYGKFFLQLTGKPFTYQNLVDAVRADVSKQGP